MQKEEVGRLCRAGSQSPRADSEFGVAPWPGQVVWGTHTDNKLGHRGRREPIPEEMALRQHDGHIILRRFILKLTRRDPDLKGQRQEERIPIRGMYSICIQRAAMLSAKSVSEFEYYGYELQGRKY